MRNKSRANTLPALRIHTNLPAPYRKHQFEQLAQVFPDTKVFFYTEMEAHRPWDFDFTSWHVCCVRMSEKLCILGLGVLRLGRFGTLSKVFLKDLFHCGRGTIHLVGYGLSGLEWWILWVMGALRWAKVVQHSDGALVDRIVPATRWKKFKNFGHAYCYIPGKRGYVAALKMGLKSTRIFNAYFSHDVKLFDAYYHAQYEMQRKKIRKLHDINTSYVVLTISRFLDWKRLSDLANALCMLEKKNIKLAQKITYILIGEGEDQGHVHLLQQLHTIRVVHLKQVPYLDVLPYYCTADLFVLPSEGDIWGLVVNEALSMRVPVICTDRVGASELIEDGVNGYVVAPRDVEGLTCALERCFESEMRLQSLKMGAGQIVTSWRTEFGVKELLKLAHS